MNEVDYYLSDANGELTKVDTEQWDEFVIALLIAMIRGAPYLC